MHQECVDSACPFVHLPRPAHARVGRARGRPLRHAGDRPAARQGAQPRGVDGSGSSVSIFEQDRGRVLFGGTRHRPASSQRRQRHGRRQARATTTIQGQSGNDDVVERLQPRHDQQHGSQRRRPGLPARPTTTSSCGGDGQRHAARGQRHRPRRRRAGDEEPRSTRTSARTTLTRQGRRHRLRRRRAGPSAASNCAPTPTRSTSSHSGPLQHLPSRPRHYTQQVRRLRAIISSSSEKEPTSQHPPAWSALPAAARSADRPTSRTPLLSRSAPSPRVHREADNDVPLGDHLPDPPLAPHRPTSSRRQPDDIGLRPPHTSQHDRRRRQTTTTSRAAPGRRPDRRRPRDNDAVRLTEHSTTTSAPETATTSSRPTPARRSRSTPAQRRPVTSLHPQRRDP